MAPLCTNLLEITYLAHAQVVGISQVLEHALRAITHSKCADPSFMDRQLLAGEAHV